MKRKLRRTIAFVMFLAMIITLLPVADVNAKTAKKAKVPVLAESSATLYLKGDYRTSYQLQIENLADGATVSYKSGNTKVAKVSDAGVVKPVKKGETTITATVKQKNKTYKLKFACTVKKATLGFGTSAAKKASEDSAAEIQEGQTLKTGLRLNGAVASVYSSENKDGNVKAVVYSAKTGKRLATSKSSASNKYVTVSENGRVTGLKHGKYYIDFISVPDGLTARLYLTVKKAKKPVVTEAPAQEVTATPIPEVTSIPEITGMPVITGTPYFPAAPGTGVSEEISVKFGFVKGNEIFDARLPENKNYQKGTLINQIPCPEVSNGYFLYWCYDEEGEKIAGSDDVIDSDKNLYAVFMTVGDQQLVEKPVFTSVNVEADKVKDFSFGIKNYKPDCVDSFVNAANDTPVEYRVYGEKVVPVLEQGETYSLTLKDETGACIVVDGEVQPESVVTFNIVTEKDDVMNLKLNSDLKYLPVAEVSGIEGDLFGGIFVADVENGTNSAKKNEKAGSFIYDGKNEINVGDIVAVYSGCRPDERTLETAGTDEDGDVGYVRITGIKGNRYSFEGAEAENVIEYAEVLPVNVNADKDGDPGNGSVRVSKDTFDYSAQIYYEIGLDASSTADEGDFIIFYEGSLESAENKTYARITAVTADGDDLIVDYVEVSEEEVTASMDVFTKRNGEINLTDEEKEALEEEIKRQAEESGFLTEAGNYLVALALETNGFKEMSEDLDFDLGSYNIHLEDAVVDANGDKMLLMDNKSKVNIRNIGGDVILLTGKKNMKHYNKDGLRFELGLILDLEFINEGIENARAKDDPNSGHLELSLRANFAEEVYFDIDISGKAVWKKKWIIPYIADYKLTSSLETGDFTEVSITSTVKTIRNQAEIKTSSKPNAEPGKLGQFFSKVGNWTNTMVGKVTVTSLSAEIKELMKKNDFLLKEDESDGTNGGELARMYSEFIKNSSDTWISIVDVPLFDSREQSVDPLHILAYRVRLSYVVKANLYVTLGFAFQRGQAKKYIFEFQLKGCKVSTSVKDISETPLEYDFFVFGTIGIRSGGEFSISVGIVSLSLDSATLIAGVGFYAQLWGYAYMHYGKTKPEGSDKYVEDHFTQGALLFEIGVYLEVKFRGQLLSKNSLTTVKPLLEIETPLLIVGDRENYIDFDPHIPQGRPNDIPENNVVRSNLLEFACEKETVLPSACFDMRYLDLKTGDLESRNYDDDKESCFSIRLSNDKFSYNPKTNTIKVNVVGNSSDKEECEMTIVWTKERNLSFSNEPISKTIKIVWTDPTNARYISYNSNGGSFIKSTMGLSGSKVIRPADPVKTGYVFDGWYTESNLRTKFEFPATMPNYENRGINVYAKWTPAKDTEYTVEYYVKNLKGQYELKESEIRKGETDTKPSVDELKKDIEGAEYATSYITSIRPDGKAVEKIYYELKKYTVAFNYGEFGNASEEYSPVVYTFKFGETCIAPALDVKGYEFVGYKDLQTDEDGCFTIKQSAEYEAQWKPSENTAYFVEHYLKNPETGAYELNVTEVFKGVTESVIDVEACRNSRSDYIFEKAEAVNTDAVIPVISANEDTIIRLYYDRAEYTLSFMDGENTVGTPTSVKWGRGINKPAEPECKGYVFSGWYTDSSCDEDSAFDFDGAVMPASDLTLYAGWVAADDTRYTVKHYIQNADDDGYTLYESDDSNYGTTESVVSADYIDIEHFTRNEAATGTVKSAAVAADGSTELKLYYDRKEVTVSFDANGGEPGADGAKKVFRYGQRFEVTDPARENYGFVGWFTPDGEKYGKDTVDETENITLIAHWDAGLVNYTVKHFVMDTDGNYGEYAGKDTMSGVVDSVIEPATLKKSLYEIPDGVVFAEAKIGNNVVTEAEIAPQMVVELYYERMQYDVKWIFDDELIPENVYTDGKVFFDSDIVKPVFTPVTGYIDEYSTAVDEKVPAHDAEYTFTRTPITYTVRFVNNISGSEQTMQDQTFRYDEQKELSANCYTREGYVFDGWSYNSNAVNADFSDKKTVSNLAEIDGQVILLYPVWKNAEYKVELVDSVDFEADSLSEPYKVVCNYRDDDPELVSYTYGTKVTLPTPYCEGFDFEGWYKDASYTGEKITDISSTDLGEKTFYPKWSLHRYAVNWNANGGSFTLPDGSVSDVYTTYETIFSTEVTVPDLQPVRAATAEYSYEFGGWSMENYELADMPTDINAETEINLVKAVPVSKDREVYAYWTGEKNEYNINWIMVLDGARAPETEIAEGSVIMLIGLMAKIYSEYNDATAWETGELDEAILNTALDEGLKDVYVPGWDSENIRNLINLYIRVSRGDNSEITQNGLIESFLPTGLYCDLNADGSLRLSEDIYTGTVKYGTRIITPFMFSSEEMPTNFIGWYNINDCIEIEKSYTDGSGNVITYTDYAPNPSLEYEPMPITPGYNDTVTGDATYVLVWDYKDYLIEWDFGVAEDELSEITVLNDNYTCKDGVYEKYDTPIIMPQLERKSSVDTDYVFEGWYTKDVEGYKFTDSRLNMSGKLFAHWSENPRNYSIVFIDSNNRNDVYENINVDKAGNVITSNIPTSYSDSDYIRFVLFDNEKDEPILDENGEYQYWNNSVINYGISESELVRYYKECIFYDAWILGQQVTSLTPSTYNYLSPWGYEGTITLSQLTDNNQKKWELTIDNCKIDTSFEDGIWSLFGFDGYPVSVYYDFGDKYEKNAQGSSLMLFMDNQIKLYVQFVNDSTIFGLDKSYSTNLLTAIASVSAFQTNDGEYACTRKTINAQTKNFLMTAHGYYIGEPPMPQ